MSDSVRVCLWKMCDWRDKCAKHVHALMVGTVHVTYFQPMRTGEFCLEFVADRRDSRESCRER